MVSSSFRVFADRKGIALPAVLATLIVVAMLSSAIDKMALSSLRSETLWTRRIQAEWLLHAGLNRAVEALVTPGDPLRNALFSRRSIAWSFSGRDIVLHLENESEKVDVNQADEGLVVATLARSLAGAPTGMIEATTRRLEEVRRQGITLASPEALLPLGQRFGPWAAAVTQAMTAVSGQSLPSSPPEVAPADGADRAIGPGTVDPGVGARGVAPPARPIYRIAASLARAPGATDGPPLAADVIVMLSPNDQRVFRIVDGHL